jgi:hypothetical protein
MAREAALLEDGLPGGGSCPGRRGGSRDAARGKLSGEIVDEGILLGVGDHRSPAHHLLDLPHPAGTGESLRNDEIRFVAREAGAPGDLHAGPIGQIRTRLMSLDSLGGGSLLCREVKDAQRAVDQPGKGEKQSNWNKAA